MKTKYQLLCMALVLLGSLYDVFAQVTTFTLASSPSVGNLPECVIAADVNGDGKVDLISANYHDGTLTVLTNDGNGGFALSSSPKVGSSYSVCAADVNGDGKVDLISANFNGSLLCVLTNNGSGIFVLASTPAVGVNPDSVCAADVNGDGKIDLISANYGSSGNSTLTVLTNDGRGGFVLSSSPFAGSEAQYVIAADINGDGKADLICANYQSPLTILTNDGTGGFALSSSPGPSSGTDCVAATDVNGDGKMDLICSELGSYNAQSTNYGTLVVLTNDGSGKFSSSLSFNVLGNSYAVCAADVNGDGKMDLISANSAYYEFEGFINNGHDGFYITNDLTVFTNDGSGSFIFATSLNLDSQAVFVCSADVNGDGKVDLIAVDDTLTILTNVTIFPTPVSIPPLTIEPSGIGMRVSWPSASAGWSLQQNPDLTTPNWGIAGYNGYSIYDDGTNKSLTLPPMPDNLFFRLLHP